MFNLFKPNLPEKQKIPRSKKEIEFRKKWYEKRLKGELITLKVPEELNAKIFPLFGLTMLFGTIFFVVLAFFTRNLIVSGLSFIIVFFLSLRAVMKPYSVIELDPDSENFSYFGLIMLGGIPKYGEYIGPIEAVEGVQIASPPRKRTKFIRFITNTGYLRLPYDKGLPEAGRNRLIELGILPADLELASKPKEDASGWKVFFERKFDRTEFYERLKEGKERERQERVRARLDAGRID